MSRSKATKLLVIALILMSALLVSCQSQVVEVTRVVEQVVEQEVTRVVTQTEVVEGETVEVTRIVTEIVEVEAEPPAEEPPAVTVLDVGVIVPRLSLLPAMVAAEDFLAPEGIVIKWNFFQSDGAIAQALASGAIDMALSSPIRAAQLNAAGGDVRLFSVAWGTIDWLLVAKDDVSSVADLSGRVVGISSPGSTTDVLFKELLLHHDMSVEGDNIAITAIGGTPARAGALAAGSIDVAWLGFDAAYTLLEEQEGFHVLDDISASTEFPGYFSITWTASKEYMDENPEIIRAITKAQIQANRWAQDKDAFVERAGTSVVSFISQQSEEQILWSVDQFLEVGMFPVNGGITPEAVQITMEIGVSSGSIEEVPAFEDIATDTFQQEVLEEIGRWEE